MIAFFVSYYKGDQGITSGNSALLLLNFPMCVVRQGAQPNRRSSRLPDVVEPLPSVTTYCYYYCYYLILLPRLLVHPHILRA